MNVNERTHSNEMNNTEVNGWFAQPGPTESFLRNAPEELREASHESAPRIKPDPKLFTAVGPTPGFVYCR